MGLNVVLERRGQGLWKDSMHCTFMTFSVYRQKLSNFALWTHFMAEFSSPFPDHVGVVTVESCVSSKVHTRH